MAHSKPVKVPKALALYSVHTWTLSLGKISGGGWGGTAKVIFLKKLIYEGTDVSTRQCLC